MITEHALPKSLCRRGQPLRVLIVGAGGNGSAVLLGLPYLHQAMKVWGHAGGVHVMLVDGDQVTETNCVRQPFAAADVGLNKAVVLINRVNLFWGLRWQAHPRRSETCSIETTSACARSGATCFQWIALQTPSAFEKQRSSSGLNRDGSRHPSSTAASGDPTPSRPKR